jgi:hypothetical protein
MDHKRKAEGKDNRGRKNFISAGVLAVFAVAIIAVIFTVRSAAAKSGAEARFAVGVSGVPDITRLKMRIPDESPDLAVSRDIK